ncbi:hypothetical protein Tco_0228096 [Tanacetum coccineum]
MATTWSTSDNLNTNARITKEHDKHNDNLNLNARKHSHTTSICERNSHEMDFQIRSNSVIKIQQCKVQEVQSSVTSSGDETSSGIVSDEEIDKQKLEAHHSYMAKIQEVSPEESSSTSQPLEQVQNHDENDVFANVRRHSEQPESIKTHNVLEKE